MEIAYLDLFYRISGDLHLDMKVCCPMAVFSNVFPFIDDLSDIEIYEIMRQPVIHLLPEKGKQLNMRLELLCCSYSSGILFIYLFSGGKCNYYMKFYQ
jgi:hypothetical protein